MTQAVIGIDVGGTKTHLVLESIDGTKRIENVIPTGLWSGETFTAKAATLARMVWTLRDMSETDLTVRTLVVGAHGCDFAAECRELEQQLHCHFPDSRCHVISDVALVPLAAGKPQAIGMIAGTGSVAIALDAQGCYHSAGGWGWLLGDEGGASGLVREAIRAILLNYDRGIHTDPLTLAFLHSFKSDHVLDLPAQLIKKPVAEWSRKAQIIFDCETLGSALAASVILQAADDLALLVDRLHQQGITSHQVVAAGGVISHQPILFDALLLALRRQHADMTLELLTMPPVQGAITLAQTLI